MGIKLTKDVAIAALEGRLTIETLMAFVMGLMFDKILNTGYNADSVVYIICAIIAGCCYVIFWLMKANKIWNNDKKETLVNDKSKEMVTKFVEQMVRNGVAGFAGKSDSKPVKHTTGEKRDASDLPDPN
jgi:hypothetical protein